MEQKSVKWFKHQCYILVLHLLIIINFCDSDIAIHNFKDVPNNIFSNSPKVWHTYIQKFLHKSLKSTSLINKYYTYLLFQMINYSTFFEKLKRKLLKVDYLSCSLTWKFQKLRLITFLFGQFFDSYNQYPGNCYSNCFKPNPLLKLNFTFHIIFIHFGTFKIINLWDTGFISNGYHSIFCLYPTYKTVIMTKTVFRPSPESTVSGSFTMIGKDLIEIKYTSSVNNYINTRSRIIFIIKKNMCIYLIFFKYQNFIKSL